jgi:hypothetical protein
VQSVLPMTGPSTVTDHTDQACPPLRGHPRCATHARLRTEVTRRSGKGPATMTVTLCRPATEVISIDAMASVDTVV